MPQYRATASTIVEWYNLTYAQRDRARQMLAALTSQAASLRSADATARVGLTGPLELIIAFDGDTLRAEEVRASLDDLVASSASIVPRFLPVSSSSYTKMKNAGAAIGRGEILIFLDCDVIPEPNWLPTLLGSFADPSVAVVVGNTYVDCADEGAYSRSMALTWMFPLRDSREHLTKSKYFYANNVAFRRDTFLSRQFPETPGLTHLPARLLMERLERDGVAIWYAPGARVSHPPPNGAGHFAKRAIAGGRARSLAADSATKASTLRWMSDDIRSVTFGCKQIALHGSQVGLRWWQVPTAMAITATYYALFHLGSLLVSVFPGFMRNRFVL